MNKVLCFLTTCWLFSPAIRAQSFRFRADVDSVQQSGYYQILLPPNVVGRLNDNLTDVRIYDNRDHEIPYLLTRQQPTQTAPFTDYQIVSKQITPDVATTLVVRKPGNARINSLGIVLKNTNVTKQARLSGSTDAQTWYAIDDAIRLGPSPTGLTTTDTKLLHFPLSDYAYYRLEITDSASAPLNILRVGNYTATALTGTYSPIPGIIVSQRDSSDKHSYIHLTRSSPARFDKLLVIVPSSTPYRRRAEVGQFITHKSKRGRLNSRFETIREFIVSSADNNVVYLSGLKAQDLYIIIANDDSPPLAVRDVRAYQLTTYLLANLTAGQAYHLSFSADNLPAPAYDLTPFRTNQPANPPVIGVDRVAAYIGDYNGVVFRANSQLIWLALGVVLLGLGFLSYRMLRDMGRSKS